MEGRFDYGEDQLPMDRYRTWRLCQICHCRPSDLDDQSAVDLDWLLAVDDAVKRAEANIARRQQGG